MTAGPFPKFERVGQPRARRRPRDPNRFPPILEFGALMAVLVVMAGANFARLPAQSADAAESASTSTTTTTTTTTTSTTTTTLPPLVAPPPTTPADLSGLGTPALMHRVPTDDPVVFITIDDGLSTEWGALALLEAEGIPFTSFLTLPFARENPDFWAEHQRVGGTMQAHTVNHSDLLTVDANTRWNEICGTHEGYASVFGRQPTIFRPPYGRYDDSVQATASGCGYDAIAVWSGSANDGTVLMQAGELRPGDIVLMHWREDLEANLRALISMADAAGLRFGQLEDYISPNW